MEIARITVERNTLHVTQHAPVTRGLVGAAVVFDGFGPEWQGLSRTAVFRSGDLTRDVVNVQEGEPAAIPWEVLQTVGAELMAGICGTAGDGTRVIPTVWGCLGRIAPGANPTGRPAEPPTPTWTGQIEGQVDRTLKEVRKTAALAQQTESNAAAAAAEADAARAEADRAAAAAALALGHGITGAEKGDLLQITQVDGQGVPTAFRPVTLGELSGTPVLIEKLTLKRAEKVTRDAEPDGREYRFRCVYLKVHVPKSSSGWIYGFRIHLHGVPSWTALITADPGMCDSGEGTYMVASLTQEYGVWKLRTGTNGGAWNPIALTGLPYAQEYLLSVKTNDYAARLESVGILPAGTDIEIKAVRA